MNFQRGKIAKNLVRRRIGPDSVLIFYDLKKEHEIKLNIHVLIVRNGGVPERFSILKQQIIKVFKKVFIVM